MLDVGEADESSELASWRLVCTKLTRRPRARKRARRSSGRAGSSPSGWLWPAGWSSAHWYSRRWPSWYWVGCRLDTSRQALACDGSDPPGLPATRRLVEGDDDDDDRGDDDSADSADDDRRLLALAQGRQLAELADSASRRRLGGRPEAEMEPIELQLELKESLESACIDSARAAGCEQSHPVAAVGPIGLLIGDKWHPYPAECRLIPPTWAAGRPERFSSIFSRPRALPAQWVCVGCRPLADPAGQHWSPLSLWPGCLPMVGELLKYALTIVVTLAR